VGLDESGKGDRGSKTFQKARGGVVLTIRNSPTLGGLPTSDVCLSNIIRTNRY